MPLDPEVLKQYKRMGPCLKPGAEIWYIQGRKLGVGIIAKVLSGKVEIRTRGGLRTISPKDVFMTTTKGTKKKK